MDHAQVGPLTGNKAKGWLLAVPVNNRPGWKWVSVINTPAVLITTVKSFIVQDWLSLYRENKQRNNKNERKKKTIKQKINFSFQKLQTIWRQDTQHYDTRNNNIAEE